MLLKFASSLSFEVDVDYFSSILYHFSQMPTKLGDRTKYALGNLSPSSCLPTRRLQMKSNASVKIYTSVDTSIFSFAFGIIGWT